MIRSSLVGTQKNSQLNDYVFAQNEQPIGHEDLEHYIATQDPQFILVCYSGPEWYRSRFEMIAERTGTKIKFAQMNSDGQPKLMGGMKDLYGANLVLVAHHNDRSLFKSIKNRYGGDIILDIIGNKRRAIATLREINDGRRKIFC